MWARMCRLVSEGVGEAITTTMAITAAIAMVGIGDIRGMGDGIGERASVMVAAIPPIKTPDSSACGRRGSARPSPQRTRYTDA